MDGIKIGIVDDHQIFLDGLKILLSNDKKFEVVITASTGKDFISKMDDIELNILLMDIEMPEMNGIETTECVLAKNPGIKIIALSMHGDEEFYYKMIHAGAKGFLLKESKSSELKEAIIKVAAGETYFAQELLRKIIFNFGRENVVTTKLNPEITKREVEVLTHICNGMSNSEIAEKMFISLRTAEGHRSNLLKKTKSKNTASLILYAIKNELVKV